MKTPLSYYGGKARIATQIVPYIMAIPHTVYSEPFFGGGAVLYAKGRVNRGNSDYYREAINDKNQNLITFWRVAREQPQELARWLQLTPYSQEEHRRALSIYRNPAGHDELKVAWAVYVQFNSSFANKVGAGWGSGVIGGNLGNTWDNRANRLPRCFERLREVHIGCEDALAFIKRWDSPQTIHYIDPPYPGTEQGHYDGYTLADYQALCEALDACQGSYVLSNYHQEIAPASAQRCIDIESTMSAANGKARAAMDTARVEKLWICDRSAGMRPDLQRVAKMPSRLEQLSLLEALAAPHPTHALSLPCQPTLFD
jgi:DNA adenine methylase